MLAIFDHGWGNGKSTLPRLLLLCDPVGGGSGRDIRQPADVVAVGPGDRGTMDIRISLDRVEPPAGRLRLVPSPEPTPRSVEGEEVPFTGWLGLLRALYEVVGRPDDRPPGRG
jgi:hypothetical protein